MSLGGARKAHHPQQRGPRLASSREIVEPLSYQVVTGEACVDIDHRA
jgi:hypothetical protein